MKLTDLRTRSLTYSEVGATKGPLPPGYHHIRLSAEIGTGRARFEAAGASVMRWGMLRGAGVKVTPSSEVAAVGSEVIVGLGPVQAPCRVVYVLDEPDRSGFAYGTLPGHPESGEELFSVRYEPATDRVYAEVVAFSRHGTWWSRLAAPVTDLVQRIVTTRYLSAV